MADSLLGQASDLLTDCIVAVSTPQGRGALGVVRLSGGDQQIEAVLHALRPGGRRLTPRQLTLCDLHDAGGVFDRALVAHFPGPHSYTGEHVLELHLHGNPVLLSQAVAACMAAGARPAEPGEFTRRALAHGKLSVVEAEGVDALIRAPSAAAARAAQRHLGGELDDRLRGWVTRLLSSAVALEALVDFPDEVDASEVRGEVDALVQLASELAELLGTVRAGRMLLDGVRVVLTGPVNAGKSTLLNALLGHDRAIVSSVPGTTRDVVSETVEWAGVAYRLEDTAGLRATDDEVEAIGIARSSAAIARADVVVAVGDGRGDIDGSAAGEAAHVLVATHADLLGTPRRSGLQDRGFLLVDGLSGQGVEAVREAVITASGLQASAGQLVLHTARQHAAMEAALGAVAEAAAVGIAEPVLAAVAVRRAGRALEELSGRWVDERVLDELFARFCIGK